MKQRTLLPEAVERYVATELTHEPPLLAELRAETAKLPESGMQIGPDQGAFMANLVRILGARRCLEVGTFTGYSALVVAAALPAGGRLVACDVSEEWTQIARRYWQRAGLADRIDLQLAPARDTLARLLREGGANSFDFAFIDADKPNYDHYYEICLQLIRPGGLIAIDNTLWEGKVADPKVHDPQTDAIRALNRKVSDDGRVDAVLVTIGDGLMLARKR